MGYGVSAIMVLIISYPLTAPAEEDPSVAAIRIARKSAAQKQRRLIYNDDGAMGAPYDTPEEFYKPRLNQVTDTHVDAVFYATGGSGTLMGAHRSEVGENYRDAIPADVADPTARQLRANALALSELGTDSLALTVDFCHRHGIEAFFSLRMNDIHDSFAAWELPKWKRTNPQFLLGREEQFSKYPHDPRKFWTALNWEHPEVRDIVFGILEDVCERYNVDGLELDWFRSPLAFPPTLRMQPVEADHLAIMTSFMRRTRTMTDRIGARRGRPILIAARLPASVERCVAVGFDLPTWMEEDLLDIVVISGGYAASAMAPTIRDMVAVARPFDIPVDPCISARNLLKEAPSAEQFEYWRGAAMNAWHAGAAGMYVFNFNPPKRDVRLSEIGNPDAMKGKDKIYALDYIIADTCEGDLRPGLVVPDRLPIRIDRDASIAAKLPVGEDIVANAPAGFFAQPRLRLRISPLAAGDKVAVKLNGRPPDNAQHFEARNEKPAPTRIEYTPDPATIVAGDNHVQITVSARRERVAAMELDHLELVTHYRRTQRQSGDETDVRE
jgi:hypothetical protein